MEAGNTHRAQGRREEGWGLDSGTGTFRNPFLQTGGGWGQLCLCQEQHSEGQSTWAPSEPPLEGIRT